MAATPPMSNIASSSATTSTTASAAGTNAAAANEGDDDEEGELFDEEEVALNCRKGKRPALEKADLYAFLHTLGIDIVDGILVIDLPNIAYILLHRLSSDLRADVVTGRDVEPLRALAHDYAHHLLRHINAGLCKPLDLRVMIVLDGRCVAKAQVSSDRAKAKSERCNNSVRGIGKVHEAPDVLAGHRTTIVQNVALSQPALRFVAVCLAQAMKAGAVHGSFDMPFGGSANAPSDDADDLYRRVRAAVLGARGATSAASTATRATASATSTSTSTWSSANSDGNNGYASSSTSSSSSSSSSVWSFSHINVVDVVICGLQLGQADHAWQAIVRQRSADSNASIFVLRVILNSFSPFFG